MAKQQISKKAKRRIAVLTPIVILAVGYLMFTIATTAIQLHHLHHEEKVLQEELTKLKGNSENLKTEITKLQDKDYVARYARENYLYTKDGEYVIKVDTKEKQKKPKKIKINEEYVMYGVIGLGILLLIYILNKIQKRHKKKKKRRK